MRRRPTTPRSTLAAALLAAFAALSIPAGAPSAAGLGRLTVQSSLGQPLRAEVEVTALSSQELQSLGARLASPEAFQQAGLQYNPALSGLRLSVQPRGGRTFVSITSNQAVNEPFVDLLIELSWAGGKLLREYTFLLDPPTLPAASAPAAPATSGVSQAASPAGSVPAAAGAGAAAASQGPAPAAATRAQGVASAAGRVREGAAATDSTMQGSAGEPVSVRRGDTLSAIAGRIKPADVNLDQAMIAIYRANPAAFAGNLNLLRAGAALMIPEASSMASLSPEEARNQVRLQSADFSRYRQQLAASAPAVTAAPGAASASGSVTGRVQDGAGPAQGADRLRLSRSEDTQTPGTGQGGAVGRSGAQASAAEQAVARDAALRESQARIEALEKTVDDLKKLLELRSRAMGDLQGQLDEARTAAKATTGTVSPSPAVAASGSTSTPAPSVPAASSAPAGAPAAATTSSPAASADSSAPATAPAVAATSDPASPKTDTSAAVPADAAAPAPSPVTEPAPTPAKPPAPTPAQPVAQPDFFDELLDNPLLLPALGGIVALGGGYALYAIRRRRRVERFEDSLIAADALAPNSLFGSTGGQSVDTRQVDLPADGPATQIQTTEVDPIEEANVYVAYGREAQAEDILREGMKRNPERHAIRQRLLELYAARSDRAGFEALARELQTLTTGEGSDWERAAALGRSLDPDNALYAAANSESGNAPPVAPTPDLDFHIDPPSDPLAEIQVQTGAAPSAEPATLDIPSLRDIPSLDLAFDLPAAGSASPQDEPTSSAQTASPTEGLRARIPDLPDALDLDLDLAALEEISRIKEPVQTTKTPAAVADLGLDLDLDGGRSDRDGRLALGANADLADLSDLTSALAEATGPDSPRWQEMATKLDLASAYDEIGDKEGARELLQEVIAGGDAQQQAKAKDMLAKLA
ncbi:MAG: hypothetical protein RLZ51_38 [Pseudomonadota bacterium]